MATATTRKAAPSPAVLKQRRQLAEQLLRLHIDNADLFAKMAGLEATLKDVATKLGESFKEDFGERGYVSASGALGKQFKGDLPIIVTEAWQALKPAERARLTKLGLVTIEPQWSKASNGRVTVKAL